ncbi:DinB family protein [Methylohalobius crimeensis]|uniref:DinB family protein n=1 Tax=Methylohalobius crimeensis TaxID=244365 RepID=UPI0003B4E76F|nr:DinB family protein [Methylohalobius crimeensis]
MNAIDIFHLQAEYNRWMNDRLYRVCSLISDAERKRDLGAYFRSIHGTLNHLLLVDRLWLERMNGRSLPIASLAEELYADFDELRVQRAATDDKIITQMDTLSADRLTQRITYTSAVTGKANSLPLGVMLTHLFNHQIHHRGQLTALINRLGHGYGVTDLIGMPGVADVSS